MLCMMDCLLFHRDWSKLTHVYHTKHWSVPKWSWNTDFKTFYFNSYKPVLLHLPETHSKLSYTIDLILVKELLISINCTIFFDLIKTCCSWINSANISKTFFVGKKNKKCLYSLFFFTDFISHSRSFIHSNIWSLKKLTEKVSVADKFLPSAS